MMVQDENQLVYFSNGMVMNLATTGVISFDLSGQVSYFHRYAKIKYKVVWRLEIKSTPSEIQLTLAFKIYSG